MFAIEMRSRKIVNKRSLHICPNTHRLLRRYANIRGVTMERAANALLREVLQRIKL